MRLDPTEMRYSLPDSESYTTSTRVASSTGSLGDSYVFQAQQKTKSPKRHSAIASYNSASSQKHQRSESVVPIAPPNVENKPGFFKQLFGSHKADSEDVYFQPKVVTQSHGNPRLGGLAGELYLGESYQDFGAPGPPADKSVPRGPFFR